MLAYWPAFAVTPWQNVHYALRRYETKHFNKTESQKPFQESIALRITLERDLHEYAKAGATDYPSWVYLDSLFHDESNQREYGFVAVNWNYTDAYLIDEFKQWLTVRQVYYQLVSRQVIENNRSQYQAVSNALVGARKTGEIPWDWIEDRLRRPRTVSMWEGLSDFADSARTVYPAGTCGLTNRVMSSVGLKRTP